LGRAFSFAYGEKKMAPCSATWSSCMPTLCIRGVLSKTASARFNPCTKWPRRMSAVVSTRLPNIFNNEGPRPIFLSYRLGKLVYSHSSHAGFRSPRRGGDLLIAPKLMPEQFDEHGDATVLFMFAGARLVVDYHNRKRVPMKTWRFDRCKVPSENFRTST